ncbi:MAG: AEC family transporter [Pseudomonadota bacterium]
MTTFDSLLNYLILLVALGGTAMMLRRLSVIPHGSEMIFGRLVTDFAMPALIFASLSTHPVTEIQLYGALLLFSAIAPVMIAAWLIGRAMRLDRPTLGSLILVSGFGGTGTLGFAIIQHVFGNDQQMMADAVVMGQFGNLLPALTIGVGVSIVFGRGRDEPATLRSALGPMVASPIFVATVLGIAASFLDLKTHVWPLSLVYEYLHIASATLSVFVAFAIGLMLKPIAYRAMAMLIIVAVALKLVIEPLIGWSMTLLVALPDMERQLLILDTALPTGTIAAVVAARYGCNGAIASALVVATLIISLILLPATIFLTF